MMTADLQQAIMNIEKVITQLINNPPEDLNIKEIITDWNTLRRALAEKMVDKT